MASMKFDFDLKGSNECLAYFRALNDGVEALGAGRHDEARARFDAADEALAALGRLRSGREDVPVVIALNGPVVGNAREFGESIARAAAHGAPVSRPT